jgi:rubredoxin
MMCPNCQDSKMVFNSRNVEENPHWLCQNCDHFILTDDEGDYAPEVDAFGRSFSDATPGL